MFNIDPKIAARLRPKLERVIVFDPQPAAARLTGELLKDMGAREVICATDTSRAMELAGAADPQLICTELVGPGFDGVELTVRLRRSTLPARLTPVIVVSAVATVESIKSARDAGAHEFLRKPYTARDLYLRVENVVLNPRVWIEARMYVGPDRRRFNAGEPPANDRRGSDDDDERGSAAPRLAPAG